jgi:arabinogalactan endo-1,4-beta-galactosidase
VSPKAHLVNSFPCYLFDIMPPLDDTEIYQKFLYETALASTIDSYKSINNDADFLKLIEYVNYNNFECDSEFLSALEEQTNIAWSNEAEAMQDILQILKMIGENFRYIQMALDKDEAVKTLQNKLDLSIKS